MSTDHDAVTTSHPLDGAGEPEIVHRPEQHRFVFTRGGTDLAHLEYVVRDGLWFITHTFTEPSERGQGLAAKVTKAALDEARTERVQVRPVCPFVVDYMAAHPEYGDLLGPARTP